MASSLSEEVGHCSNHQYHASGCPDCSTAVLYQAMCASTINKAVIVGTHPLQISPAQHNPRIQLIKQQMIRKLYVFLVNSSSDVVQAMKKKAAQLGKIDEEKKREIFLAGYLAIQWEDLVLNVTSDLFEAAHSGGLDGLNQLDISQSQNLETVEKFGREYALARAAEMVGMKLEDGKLVANPSARFTVTSLTKDDLKDAVEDSLDRNLSIDEIGDEIKDLGIFSRNRANLIADTEMTMALFEGNIKVWKDSKLVKMVGVVTSDTHSVEDICDEISKAGPYSIEKVPNFPIHPNCECSLVAVEMTQGG